MQKCGDYFYKQIIDKSSPVPLYHQIKEIILEYISSCEESEIIPTELDLQRMYDVSRSTIRQAVNELVTGGYLYRKKGTGTFVAKERLVQFGYLESLFETAVKQGHEVSTKVLEFRSLKADKKTAGILSILEGGETFLLRRLRFIDENPNHIATNYLSAAKFPGLQKFNFEKESLMRVIKEEYGIVLKSQTSTIEARRSGKYESGLLGISVGSPVQYVSTVNYTVNDIPADYYFVMYRGDLHRITYQIKF